MGCREPGYLHHSIIVALVEVWILDSASDAFLNVKDTDGCSPARSVRLWAGTMPPLWKAHWQHSRKKACYC